MNRKSSPQLDLAEKEAIRDLCRSFASALEEHLIESGTARSSSCADSYLAMRCAQEVEGLRYEIDHGGSRGLWRDCEHATMRAAALAVVIWDNVSRRTGTRQAD